MSFTWQAPSPLLSVKMVIVQQKDFWPNFWSLATNISLFVILCCGGLEKTSPSINCG